jgi:hypothetical protein
MENGWKIKDFPQFPTACGLRIYYCYPCAHSAFYSHACRRNALKLFFNGFQPLISLDFSLWECYNLGTLIYSKTKNKKETFYACFDSRTENI